MTSNGRRSPMEDNLKYEKWNISTTTGRILLKLKLKLIWSNHNGQRYQMEMTSNGRRSPMEDDLNMKSGIYQQPLVGSFSNLKLKLWDEIRVYKGIKWRRPPVEDNLKIWNISASTGRILLYLISQQPLGGSYSNLKLKLLASNHSEKMYQMKTTSNGRQPPTEDNL
jgi:hypothetical protein